MEKEAPESLYLRKKYPALIHILNFIYSTINLILNKIFSSRLNPLSQSGGWTVFFLSAAFISGTGLIFFYKISDPYNSIVHIQQMTYLAKWLRAMHRYSADAAVITITFHILKMMIEGKTWGPRLFSWTTGVLNTGLLFISAYTGYVMLWDNHARLIALRGAQLLDYLHFSSEPMAAIFSGEKEPDSTFFFINLFAHVAVPLAMAIMLWLHTSRLTRPEFFPEKKRMIVSGTLLFVTALFISAPLLPEADLLSLGVNFPIDLFYSIWFLFPPEQTLLILSFFFIGVPAALFLLPLIWRPRPKKSKGEFVSQVNLDRCNGSAQCYEDCPYGAIEMRDRPDKNEQYAFINNDHCVGCALCSASCRVFAIGPKGKTGTDILHELKNFLLKYDETETDQKKQVIVFSCIYNEKVNSFLKNIKNPKYALYELPCTGILHSAHIHSALGHFPRAALINCAESQCVFRFGNILLKERVDGKRKPSLPEIQNEERVIYWSGAEENLSDLRSLIENNKEIDNKKASQISRWSGAWGVFFLFLFFISVAAASQSNIPSKDENGMLRLAWKLAGQREEICRNLSEKEILTRPVHMRKSQDCKEIYYAYILNYKIGDFENEQLIRPAGARKDRPLIVLKEIDLKPGNYSINITFSALEKKTRVFTFNGQVQILPGKVALITRDKNQDKLIEIKKPL